MRYRILSFRIALLSFAFSTGCVHSPKLADQYWHQAEELRQQGQYLEAAQIFARAVEAEKTSPEPRLEELAAVLNRAAWCYNQVGNYEESLAYQEEALAVCRQLGDQGQAAVQINNLGVLYAALGRYEQAVDYYEEALEIDRGLGLEADVAAVLNNLGSIYRAQGDYGQAAEHFEQALEIDRRLDEHAHAVLVLNNLGDLYMAQGSYDQAATHLLEALEIERRLGQGVETATVLGNLGSLYRQWGRYEQAVEHFGKALEIERQQGREPQVAMHLVNLGEVFQVWGRYESAIESYEQALEIERRLNRQAEMAVLLNNLGMVYKDREEYERAVECFEQALEIDRDLGQEGNLGVYLMNLGGVDFSRGQYREAIDYYGQALDINIELGRQAVIAAVLNDIGQAFIFLEEYAQAIHFLEGSVELKEELRRTAPDELRRDYLASEILSYQLLTLAFIRQQDLPRAFHAIELGRAKYLAEKLATGADLEMEIPSIAQIQDSLPARTAALVYANTNLPYKTLILITKEEQYSTELADSTFVGPVLRKHGIPIQAMQQRRQKLERTARPKIPIERLGQDFVHTVEYYRHQLMDPSVFGQRGARLVAGPGFGSDDTGRGADLGRHLYDFLIGPVEARLDGKEQLIIVPDGVLGFVPFETLVDEEGRYLAERFDIRYAQSLSVLKLLQKRRYDPERRPLLAFGGAIYDEITYDAEMVQNGTQLAHLEKDVSTALDRGGSVRSAYAALDRTGWTNLPGTLSEVEAIARTVPGVQVLTGDQVSESTVKKLSGEGALARYKVLHFATHGLVVPELPELSALVLSQFAAERDGEDGYLRMGEIAALELKADFANLSACETGLGRLFGGEGVVGLTQSFLLAGANGLAVSLWQVADNSTAEFMAALYAAVQEEGMSYAEATAAVKRRFILGAFGERYAAPYYWAPFVYYGK